MATELQVTCVTKPEGSTSHEHITHLGVVGWGVVPVAMVVAALETKTYRFYTLENGRKAYLQIYKEHFVRTVADSSWTDNLLSLRHC